MSGPLPAKDVAQLLEHWGPCDQGCGGAQGDCFAGNFSGGCSWGSCCQNVCGIDRCCCTVIWDELCAGVAWIVCADS